MMTVGVSEVWGDDDPYVGTWFIKSVSANKYTPGDYYICPTEGWIYYTGTNSFTETPNGQPFLTTYQCKTADYDDVRKAVWKIEKSDNYYTIKHALDGRYMVYNGKISDASAGRIRVHLANVDIPTSEGYELFVIGTNTAGNIVISPKNESTTNFFNVCQGNINDLAGSTLFNKKAKNDGPTSHKNDIHGTIGLWNDKNDENAPFLLEDASSCVCVTPTITFDNATNEVTISTTTPEATIYYTTDPDISTSDDLISKGSQGGSSITINVSESSTIKAIATKSDIINSEIATKTISKVATPNLDYNPDTHIVTLACATTDAAIHYKIGDGTYTDYNTPFAVENNDVIYAYATKEGCINSDQIEPYTVLSVCAEPTIAVTYDAGTATVTITNNEAESTIHYTIDGSVPNGESRSYSSPFNITSDDITSGTTVRAIAVKTGYNNSNVVEETVSQVAMPVIAIENNTIKITCATDGATIYYTVDGGDATAYIGALGFEASGKAITAYATKTGMVTSATAVADANSTKLQLAAPVITYNPATNKVVITAALGTIKYTTGETETAAGEPMTEYTVGDTGFDLPNYHHVIKAIAEMSTAESSEVAQLTIAVQPTTDDSNPRPYLVQSVQCTDFYMIPGDNAYLNTSSLGRASMEWCFYSAGNEGGVEYYYIKNKATNQYVYWNTDNGIRLHASSNFGKASNKNMYKFSINYSDTETNPGYFIHPYNNATAANGLSKNKGNNTADNFNLADATNTANSNARWNFIPSASYSVPLPFTAWGEGRVYKYYKIKKDATNYLLPRTQTVSYAMATVAANVSGPANSILWYFDKDDASSDDWVSYYYIVNAATGEYLYFNGANTTASNNNAFEAKEFDDLEKDRYLFAFANTTTADFCYILPKALQQGSVFKNNNYNLIYWENKELPLKTVANRANDQGKWTFEEVAVTELCPPCPPRIYLAADGNVTLSPRTKKATTSYQIVDGGGETPFDESAPTITTMPTNGGQVVIKTKTTISGVTTEKDVTIVYKPIITLAEQSVVYNGQTHAPELSKVEIGTEDITNYCEVSTNDINAGNENEATAIITQKENNPFYADPYYVIYGTAPFTIEKSPLTIYADSKMIEYGDQINIPDDLSFSTFGLASSDVVDVNLSCASGTEIGNYPITFNGTYTIKRHVDGTDASSNYNPITLVASSLVITAKSIGDGTVLAEHISIDLTEDAPIVKHAKVGGEVTLTENTDYTLDEGAENSRKEIICTISGKGNYTGAAQVSLIRPFFVKNQGETATTEYIAAFNGSMDWMPAATAWDPTNGSKKVWMLTSVNPALSIVQAKQVNYLPKDMPVLLTSGDNEATGIKVSVKSSETTPVSNADRNGNLLKMVPENKDNPAQGLYVKNGQVYVFYNNATNGTGEFVLALEGWLRSGKFYIDNPNYSPVENSGGSAPKRLKISRGESTAISEIQNSIAIESKDTYWYSIDGRRLNGKPTAKGIYIVNGKKVVLK